MAAPVKKKRLHELDGWDGPTKGGVVLFSQNEKDYQLDVSKLGGIPPAVIAVDASSGTADIQPVQGTDFHIDLTLAKTTVTVDALPDVFWPDNTRFDILITLKQGTGANLVDWPTTIKWPHDMKPVLSYTAGQEDIIVLSTTDKGVSWKGATYAQGY